MSHPRSNGLCLRTLTSLLLSCLTCQMAMAADDMEATLRSKAPNRLLAEASVLGDPERGAVLFHQPSLGCVQCHLPSPEGERLGPDLTTLGERATYDHIIQSILDPSEIIAEGFENWMLLTDSGQVIQGKILSETDTVITVQLSSGAAATTVDPDEVVSRKRLVSTMPAQLANRLTKTSDFYDLVGYVVEIGRGGQDAFQRLQPSEAEIAVPPLPEYESKLDHAAFITEWDPRTFDRGAKVYQQVCQNCHGDHDEAGSLPNALRFASGQFNSGSDPFSMYRTLTHGYRMMLPQHQLVPRQKYDVIHFIRESYLKEHNPDAYVEITPEYLAGLPSGTSRGARATRSEPWREMDYGPFLISTYEINGPDTEPRRRIPREELQAAAREGRAPRETWPDNTNFAYKGIAVRLDDGPGGISRGSDWIVFDHDTMRVAAAWSGEGFIDWEGILFNGHHAVTPRTVDDLVFQTPAEPGWANPQTGSFEDSRLVGKDGRHYGPLPKEWAEYKGIYKHADRVIIAYQIGEAEILETQGLIRSDEGPTVWQRVLNIGPRSHELLLRTHPNNTKCGMFGDAIDLSNDPKLPSGVTRILPSDQVSRIEIRLATKPVEALLYRTSDGSEYEVEDLRALTHGGKAEWTQKISTTTDATHSRGPFHVDTLQRPIKNPWNSRLRLSGLDFLDNGQGMVVCCADGDVWKITGHANDAGQLSWRRIASGLFHPLGIKVVDGAIYVTCRDQIVILRDLNNDGETDFYECFNDDHQVTDHFHEFAMGLQADEDGNLYYAKSARHARDSLVPHHGTLLKVSADGQTTQIVANGFRAANGVCLNPDGSFFVTDQEGHWTPMNRINRVVEGGFYGNIYSYGAPDDTSDQAMQQPLCWPNKPTDRSPAELLWVDSQKWGSLNSSLLSLSYGYGKVFVVPHEQVGQTWQGGICQLPIPRFETGVMRGRFSPGDGQLYVCGMQAWGSDQTESTGGLYRVRATDQPKHLPTKIEALSDRIRIQFTEPIDKEFASDTSNFLVDTWGLRRTANYGSRRYDEKSMLVESASVSNDGLTLELHLPDLQPTWCMEISYRLKDSHGEMFRGSIQNTIHQIRQAE
ncbi:c-type cytochrome [Rhodopirellula sp. JC740]|uniref:C-type cytochrome n=1 Tax=Rhodopirellula halodulae TaxID=2894198 RepID=A0ABS8NNL2_9BACT|nr:DUF6797 domain-containing protein [Rhodopirellula sp. JC740]MCC9644964.1 c-type cytochrome [Rhodopirellula sp. JC740]